MTIRLTFCASVGAILFGWGGLVMRVDDTTNRQASGMDARLSLSVC